MIQNEDSLKELGAEHEDSLPWLELPYGETVELVVVGQPIFALIHSAFPLKDGEPRDYGCRQMDAQPCPICVVSGYPARQVAYAIVEKDGQLWLFKAKTALLNKVDLEPGLRLRVERLKGNPFFRVHDSETDLGAACFDYDDRPRTLVKRLTSQSYWLKYGGKAVLDFFNRPSEKQLWED